MRHRVWSIRLRLIIQNCLFALQLPSIQCGRSSGTSCLVRPKIFFAFLIAECRRLDCDAVPSFDLALDDRLRRDALFHGPGCDARAAALTEFPEHLENRNRLFEHVGFRFRLRPARLAVARLHLKLRQAAQAGCARGGLPSWGSNLRPPSHSPLCPARASRLAAGTNGDDAKRLLEPGHDRLRSDRRQRAPEPAPRSRSGARRAGTESGTGSQSVD